MAYSDEELFIAAQIAYYDISKKDVANLKNHGKEPTLQEILTSKPKIVEKLHSDLEKAKNAESPVAISKAQGDLDLYKRLVSPKSEYSKWKIVDVKDDNDTTGFYGLLIETSPENAIVGYRGSESEGNQFEKDWVQTDFKMLNESVGVEQQKVAAEYMNYIYKNFPYDQYATAGHSLGGNISFYAAITAPPEMRAKIIQALNGDGPGFANEFLTNPKYADAIKEMATRMNHYQWSLVGAILNPVPGSNYMSLKTKDNVYGKYDLASLTGKHSMTFVDIDVNGRVIKGDMDKFAASIGKLTTETDELPSAVGNSLVATIEGFFSLSDKDKKIFGVTVVANLALLAVTYPVAAVAGLVVAGTIAVIGWIDPEFFGEKLIPFLLNSISFTADMVQKVIDGITSVISKAIDTVNMAKEFVNQLKAEVVNAVAGFVLWAWEKVSPGFAYASAHPVIKVDTYKLRNYAERLKSVNRRLNSLDRRMDSLYCQSNLIDLISLAQADLMTSESRVIRNCIAYLEETAESFETAERNIINKMS